MKFLIAWTLRGGSAADNETDAARMLEIYGKWTPPSDEQFLEFLGRLDGRGGYSLVETDNPDSLGEAPAKFSPYLDFEIIPVTDIAESVRLGADGVAFRESVPH